MESISEFISTLTRVIVNPIIQLMFAAALAVFLWGVFEYVKDANAPDKRQQGLRHIIWGIVGLVIMVSVFGIINIATGTFLN